MDVLSCHSFKIGVEITTPLLSPPNSPNCQEALRAPENTSGCLPRMWAESLPQLHSTKQCASPEEGLQHNIMLLRHISEETVATPLLSSLHPPVPFPEMLGWSSPSSMIQKKSDFPECQRRGHFASGSASHAPAKFLNNR